MLSHFLKGKTHDIYGLILVVITNFYLLFSTHAVTHEVVAVLDLMTATGIMADIWAHCFHH
jgi:hypothetical protein